MILRYIGISEKQHFKPAPMSIQKNYWLDFVSKRNQINPIQSLKRFNEYITYHTATFMSLGKSWYYFTKVQSLWSTYKLDFLVADFYNEVIVCSSDILVDYYINPYFYSTIWGAPLHNQYTHNRFTIKGGKANHCKLTITCTCLLL